MNQGITRRHPETNRRKTLSTVLAALLGIIAATPAITSAQTATFYFQSICRSAPEVKKDIVTVTLVQEDRLTALADVTMNALWTYVDYRQNHAVFRYKQTSCTTNSDGVCTFNGGSGRARWQLSEVVGYDMGSPAFVSEPTTLCPNTLMIDFW
jgi:hypothetical protein